MTREKIVDEIWKEVKNLYKRDIEKVVVELLKTIQDKIIASETIHLRGFGTFGSKLRHDRIAYNLKTGEKIFVPEHRTPYFMPGKELKELKQQSKKQNSRNS